MDGVLFDVLSRRFSPSGNRRFALATLLGGAITARSVGEGVANNKKKNKKRKKRRCPCPGGRVRLPNGSCAAVCAASDDCAAGCVCRLLGSTEGGTYCSAPGPCGGFPQTCQSTSQCPLGQACQFTSCVAPDIRRCIALCG